MDSRLTYPNVASTLAVILAIAGGSAALGAVPDDDSVTSESIVNGDVRSRDLADDKAVDSSDIRDRTIAASDVVANTVRHFDLATGAIGSMEISDEAVESREIADGEV